MNQSYQDFLQGKIKLASDHGFTAYRSDMKLEALKPHCVDVVQWACRKGAALIAASFGLHKTRMNIEVLRQVRVLNPHAPVLVVCPLGVKHQFQYEDGPAMGVDFQYIRNRSEQHLATSDYHITNYERVRDGDLDLSIYQAVALDEGSCLRSLGSDTTQEFIKKFKFTQFKFVYTATPSPNEYLELINYADFLGVMDRGQALTRFFKRDSQKAGNLKIHPQHEEAFWLWVSSWALFLTKPSDLGYSDEGYELPPMQVHYHMVDSDPEKFGTLKEKDGQVKAFADSATSLPEAAKIKRATIEERLMKVLDIVSDSIIFNDKTTDTNANQTGESRLHATVSEDVSASQVDTGRKGRKKQAKKGAVRERSSVPSERTDACDKLESQQSGKENQPTPEADLRNNDRGLQGEVDSSELQVCDLRNGESVDEQGTAVRGSLSRNRSVPGTALSAMQLRIGSLQKQYESFIQGNGVPTQFITFCILNPEQEQTKKSFAQIGIATSSLTGEEDIARREDYLYDWKEKKTTAFLSKPVISGVGLNLQQCHEMIFMSVNHKFHDIIQAIHRVYRFGQKHPVNIHIIYTREETSIIDSLKKKWKQHDVLQQKMRDIIKQYGLNHSETISRLSRSFGVERKELSGKNFLAINNDSVLELPNIESNSVGLIHTSIPFGNHYEYSASYNDFGHNDNNDVFWKQMDFLLPELFRVLKPGRNAIIHVKDRIRYSTMTGAGCYTTDPFSDECGTAFRKHGFLRLGGGRITIPTDVVRENNQTYRLGWTEKCKDASKMGCGLPEYLLLFRKPQSDLSKGYADEPVVKDKSQFTRSKWQIDAHSMWLTSGNRLASPDDIAGWNMDHVYKWFKTWCLEEVYDYYKHVAIGERLDERGKLPTSFGALLPDTDSASVMTNVNYMRGLNAEQSKNNVEHHICPLPFDIVERVLDDWSMEGDTVLDPFAGLMTVPLVALKKKRRGVGIELNADYFRWGCNYLKNEEQKITVPTLFDFHKEDAA